MNYIKNYNTFNTNESVVDFIEVGSSILAMVIIPFLPVYFSELKRENEKKIRVLANRDNTLRTILIFIIST